LHSQAGFAVLDRERHVDVLVQGHGDVRHNRVLIHNGIRGGLALCGELRGATGVDHIAELGHERAEIAMNQAGHDHVLFENGQRLLRPDLGNQSIIVVRKADQITEQVHYELLVVLFTNYYHPGI